MILSGEFYPPFEISPSPSPLPSRERRYLSIFSHLPDFGGEGGVSGGFCQVIPKQNYNGTHLRAHGLRYIGARSRGKNYRGIKLKNKVQETFNSFEGSGISLPTRRRRVSGILINSGVLTMRSRAIKPRKTYWGPIRSQIIPDKTAIRAFRSIREKRTIPSHLPICSGGTNSLSMAAVMGAPM